MYLNVQFAKCFPRKFFSVNWSCTNWHILPTNDNIKWNCKINFNVRLWQNGTKRKIHWTNSVIVHERSLREPSAMHYLSHETQEDNKQKQIGVASMGHIARISVSENSKLSAPSTFYMRSTLTLWRRRKIPENNCPDFVQRISDLLLWGWSRCWTREHPQNLWKKNLKKKKIIFFQQL